ncbi:DNA/RNA non-specific endonuclease [Hymenobacter sp. BT683]|uniref:DNA/RNA non-specific endonuclease n=1 Tax=Hymenobacter jeongseonensis TaxID=2791027 RepID=A0ABS0IHC9_9BACT|nr:DNA/RNA non-specific endonuclease [Hymenobacter jeongseonensis]MBF9237582.1 DNA/RNA non-specific endonuclease [Hymenobacter jeongseonensis]
MYRPSLLILAFALLACSQQSAENTTSRQQPAAARQQSALAPFPETFETGSKGAYAEADEPLATGSWKFAEALVGNSPQDHKNGERAARLHNLGRIRMNFDVPAGVQRISISAAAYGQDDPSTWELWLSRDGGRSYQQTGQRITTRGPQLVPHVFEGVANQSIRLEIRKTSGQNARLNIDDIRLETAQGAAVAANTGVTGGYFENRTSTQPTAPAQAPTARTTQPSTGRTQAPTSPSDNLALGNPSGATSDPANASNYLLVHPEFTIGYHAARGIPTWVSWHVGRGDLGKAPRQNNFRPDAALPRQFYQVSAASYSRSGFDKGHNCPSGDRTADLDANSATFLMTNMVPQAPQNNQKTWASLEEYGRAQVQRGQELYIVMGSYGRGGTGANGFAQTIDQGRVTVPARIWKVMVIMPEGQNDLQRLATEPSVRVLAIDTPNDNAVSPDWQQYLTSVDKLEAATGLDLLSALPRETQARLQKLVDGGRVQ